MSTKKLPAIGTRWGDVDPYVQEAMPVGTRLGSHYSDASLDVARCEDRYWRYTDSTVDPDPMNCGELDDDRRILSYPPGTDYEIPAPPSIFPCWGKHERLGHRVTYGRFSEYAPNVLRVEVPECPADPATFKLASPARVELVPMGTEAFYGFTVMTEDRVRSELMEARETDWGEKHEADRKGREMRGSAEYKDGRMAFKAGFSRDGVRPEYSAATSTAAWLAGWDSAKAESEQDDDDIQF